MGLEPTTFGLGSRCSTTELHPLRHILATVRDLRRLDLSVGFRCGPEVRKRCPRLLEPDATESF